MYIKVDDVTSSEVIFLLHDHLQSMAQHSPKESIHALDVEQLKQPDITFWSAWIDGCLAGCGALKDLNNQHGEIKSMKTATNYLRKGVARQLLLHIITEATLQGYKRLSLETGTSDAFLPAQKLYESLGFSYCPPFADYKEDPHSTFMTMTLS